MAKSEKPVGRFFADDKQKPVDLDRAAGIQIFDALKLAILRMDIPPGSLISEVDVGRRFSASRTPVREAFMQLREAGLVVTLPSRGNFVTKLSGVRIREARFVRQALELATIEDLCNVGLPADYRGEIEDVLAQQEDCLPDERHSLFFELDDKFHLLLARATGHHRVAELLAREKMVLDRLRVLSLGDIEHRRSLFEEHVMIFRAILDRDAPKAASLMRAHLMKILETLSNTADRNSEYFE